MKYLYFIIAIVSTLKCFAQDPQLFDNTWYLQKVIIDDVDYLPPFSSFRGELNFSNDNLDITHPYCEESFGTIISYENLDVFNLEDNPVILLGSCVDPTYVDFMDRHYSIYFLDGQFAKNPFSYFFGVDGNGIKVLTVTNDEGNQGIYGNQLLSVGDITPITISIYPNPVDDILYFSSESHAVLSISIFDLLGAKLDDYSLNSENGFDQISISNLDSGIYFLRILTDRGETTKKIIKK